MNEAEGKVEAAADKRLSGAEWVEKMCKEIEEAKRDWINATTFFDYAVGKDQVDYAIYAIISAEKRYEMLLRTAKQSKQKWPEWGMVSR